MRKVLILAMLVGLVALVSVASAALPTTVYGMVTYPTSLFGYAQVNIISGGTGDLPNSPPLYVSWCSDRVDVLQNGDKETWNVYSTLGLVPSQVPTANWGAINWILNNEGSNDKYTIQSAIWQLGNGEHNAYWTSISGGPVSPGEKSAVSTLVTNAISHSSFVPSAGQWYGVILWDSVSYQDSLIPVRQIPYVPEFPTVGLPIAMVLGMVFIVYVLKRRSEY